MLFLVEKKIILQQQMFLLGHTVDADFSLEDDFYKYISSRQTEKDPQELEKVSEWIVDLNNLQDFANKLNVHK